MEGREECHGTQGLRTSGYKPGEEESKREKQCLQKPKLVRELEGEGTAKLGIIKVYRLS